MTLRFEISSPNFPLAAISNILPFRVENITPESFDSSKPFIIGRSSMVEKKDEVNAEFTLHVKNPNKKMKATFFRMKKNLFLSLRFITHIDLFLTIIAEKC